MRRFTNLSFRGDREQARFGQPGQARSGMSAYLVQELRDSHPYLQDKGWHNVARLMLAAADELERLDCRVRELESRKGMQSSEIRR